MRGKILRFGVEDTHLSRGRSTIIGCDEVGRGCLAGPVVAAAVVFDWRERGEIEALARDYFIADSKIVTEGRRREAAQAIHETAREVSIRLVKAPVIDEINILQASLLAIRKAVTSIEFDGSSTIVLIDGNQRIKRARFEQETVIDGDAKVFSIAAASIVAKVYRDKLMTRLHKEFPMYNWAKNKGYGTPEHKKAIEEHGLTDHHRKTFCHIAELGIG